MSTDKDSVEQLATALKQDDELRGELADEIVQRMDVDGDTPEGEAAQSYRRDVLKALGVLGTGAALGGAGGMAATQGARAGTDQAGTIGTSNDPVDIEAEDINSERLQTDRSHSDDKIVTARMYQDGSTTRINGRSGEIASNSDPGQALKDAISSTGKGMAVTVANGTYTFGTSVDNIPSLFELRGENRGRDEESAGVIFKQGSNLNGDLLQSNNQTDSLGEQYGVTIKNIDLIGDKSNATGHGINMVGVENLQLINGRTTSFPECGLVVRRCHYSRIQDWASSGHSGADPYSTNQTAGDYIRLQENSQIQNLTGGTSDNGHGVLLDELLRTRVIGMRYNSADQHGVYLRSVSKCGFIALTANTNDLHGVFGGATDTIFLGGEVFNNAQDDAGNRDGMRLFNATDCVVYGLRAYDSQGTQTQRNGISGGNLTRVRFRDCDSKDNINSGIDVDTGDVAPINGVDLGNFGYGQTPSFSDYRQGDIVLNTADSALYVANENLNAWYQVGWPDKTTDLSAVDADRSGYVGRDDGTNFQDGEPAWYDDSSSVWRAFSDPTKTA